MDELLPKGSTLPRSWSPLGELAARGVRTLAALPLVFDVLCDKDVWSIHNYQRSILQLRWEEDPRDFMRDGVWAGLS